MHAHEAGALHAEGYRGPSWLRTPVDVNALVPSLWATSVGRGSDGVLTVGGVSVTDLAREFGTPAYIIDEDDFRSRARDFKQTYAEVFDGLSGGADVFYAGKAFLCTEVARWIHDEGLHLDVCSGGELAVAMRAGVPGERIGLHGNNKSVAEIRAALDYGVSRIVIDSFDEIERVAAVASELGVIAPVLIRVTVGVEAHTHEFIATAHEDQKFGLSLSGGHAFEAARRILERPDTLRLLGLHSHIGSQIFDTAGFEVSARRILGLHTQIARELGVRAARARPRRWLRHRLHDGARPAAAEEPRGRHGRDHRAGVPRRRRRACRASRSSRAGRSPGRAPSRSTRSAPSSRSTSTGERPGSTSRSTAA